MTEPEPNPTIRKRTTPDPISSGKKRKVTLLSGSGKPFDFGKKVTTTGIETTCSIKVPMLQTGRNTQDQPAVRTSGTKTDMGTQCSMAKRKVEHHRVVETVRTFKENGADVTRKETHESRWVE